MQRKDEEMELQFFWTNNHRYSEPDHQYQSCLCYGKGLFNHKSLKIACNNKKGSLHHWKPLNLTSLSESAQSI